MYDRTTVQPYNRTTVQGATFNMCGQLYHRHANAKALFSSPVVSALGSESDDPGSSRLTAAWLAQLVECQSAVREVEGSSPRPDQHSGS